MVDAVTRWAFEEHELMRVQLEHALGNPASCRVAELAGFRLEETARSAYALPDGEREDCHLHGRRRPTRRRPTRRPRSEGPLVTSPACAFT